MISSLHELPDEIITLAFLLLEKDGVLIPFFIKELHFINSRNFRVSFLDVTNQEGARPLVNCAVYLETNQLPNVLQVSKYNDIINYTVRDTESGELGIVEEMIENPGQDLLVVKNGDHEILIPVADEMILSVDHKKKCITVDLPQGLVDLNT